MGSSVVYSAVQYCAQEGASRLDCVSLVSRMEQELPRRQPVLVDSTLVVVKEVLRSLCFCLKCWSSLAATGISHTLRTVSLICSSLWGTVERG